MTKEEIRDVIQNVIKRELVVMMEQLNSTIITVINRELEPTKIYVRDLSESLNFHTNEFDKLQQEND